MEETNSWTSEFGRAFKNVDSLYAYLGWELNPSLIEVARTYPLFVPLRLAEKIKAEGEDGVLAREFLPSFLEEDEDLNSTGSMDPIGDKAFHKAPQLIHRYPSRVLFTPTSICPVHCRYCFRKNELNQKDELFTAEFNETLSYLRSHPEITEIIFTGGDPLTLANSKLSSFLQNFSEISHIKHIRFHTRYPVILPERIDSGFVKLLSDFSEVFQTISIAIHANHKNEFDECSRAAIRRLAATPVQLLSQTVLLKGINDDTQTLVNVINEFLDMKIRPYYLHHPDRVKGGMHFYLPLEAGRKIYGELRSYLPGWAIPQYVIDVPGGAGKIPAFNPESHTYAGKLLSLSGTLTHSPEPDLFR